MTQAVNPASIQQPEGGFYGKVPAQQENTQFTPIDLWGASEEHVWYFPGQENVPDQYKQYVTFVSMNEGRRTRYQKKTSRPLHIERENNDARMTVDQAADRHALLETSITGWKIFRGGDELMFRPSLLLEFLKFANPLHIDKLEKAIRDANPWMIAEMTSEQIEKEIANLEQKLVAVKRQEEEDADFDDK
jgi:hypothetical protein